MNCNIHDCEQAERDPGVCNNGQTLAILKDVHKAYLDKLGNIERIGASGPCKLQLKVDLLSSWVDDLSEQNSLLARAVEELEMEATNKLLIERQKNVEMVAELRTEIALLRRRLTRKDSDLRGVIEVLRRLREFDHCTLDGIRFFEVTESDIFGSLERRQKNLEQGDTPDQRKP